MQAIYRKYRPDTFDKVYGQKHITDILKNQIETKNISHAYIFSGSRGTGKTSCAKIFARAINCLDLQDGNPCNKCENCLSSLEESTLDIVEMDAASNRRIDDIRELRDKVIYPPTKLKYKVYIIDEAHMITNEGFNALLKIMEEPPKHLVFILATTEIDKIPQTILSRCQRYEFKMINAKDISDNIKYILNDLNRKMDDDAIELIANKADGAMRDALSILDQVLSIEKENITKQDINDILGIVDNKGIFKLVNSIIKKDAAEVLNNLYTISYNKPVENVMDELLNHFRNLLLSKNGLENIRQNNTQYNDDYNSQSELITNRQIVESMSIIIEHQKKLKQADNQKALLEILVMRLIDYIDYDDLIARVNTLEDKLNNIEQNGIKINSTQKLVEFDEKIDKNIETSQKSSEKVEKSDELSNKNDIIKTDEKNDDTVEEESVGKDDSFEKLREVLRDFDKVPKELADDIKASLENDKLVLKTNQLYLYTLLPHKKVIEQLLKPHYDFKVLDLQIDDEAEKKVNENVKKLQNLFGENVQIIEK
ncbi:MAG: DNA polymerase III subunit gamma/tau [Finegoldia magna]|uniref:DNA polymerase III subunit gamma/tau n=1 Tax=Finegoldia magna TaxID=1260 RepID=UPI000B91B615|nr:DNA polymerase III subunit gamma/tau [Finegoldia magna]MDU1010649.1 DNA polymerase III subunit gamma/tau [Finegoldia magna]MDU7925421.1 DNA polymerase III subunit gamma/tau [Finegoldia magna]OXZ39256.1 DNA polymerase III subunit gamma/tau [Finegoldia magna]